MTYCLFPLTMKLFRNGSSHTGKNLLLEEQILSLRDDPPLRGRKTETGVASLECVPNLLRSWC